MPYTLPHLRDEIEYASPFGWLGRLADPIGDEPTLTHLVTRRRAGTTGPDAVEITFDSRSGRLDELVCAGLRLRKGSRRFSLRIQLVDTGPLPGNWFELEAHRP